MEEILFLKDAVRAVAAAARCSVADHPMPDELVDYHAGDLTAEERERIQDHLAVCPDCARAVLEMNSLPEPATLGPAERLGDRELTAEWERFRERTGPIRLHGGRRWAERPVLRYGLAAVLALAVAGLTFQLGRRVGGLQPVALQVQTIDLYPAGEVLRGDENADAAQIGAWADALILRLALENGEAAGGHEVAIVAADGREVWRQGDLHSSPDGVVSLLVPRAQLPSGTYLVRLFAAGPGTAPEAEYSLALRR
jgi:Putative zinc-finger